MALKRAGIEASDIDYINAHGTSTMADTIELGAVERRGRQCGREGLDVVDKIVHRPFAGCRRRGGSDFSLLAIRDNVAPPTLNLDNPDIETQIDLVPKVARSAKINVALSNSFGFGGTNASLVLRRFEA
jgi:3-oxoacyl-[acyl-carrier-protein] synthase II